jgi:hypothetical protein
MLELETGHLKSAKADLTKLHSWIKEHGWEEIQALLARHFGSPITKDTYPELDSSMKIMLGTDAWKFLKFCLFNGAELEDWSKRQMKTSKLMKLLPDIRSLVVRYGDRLDEAARYASLGSQGASQIEVLEARDPEGNLAFLQFCFDLINGQQEVVRLPARLAIGLEQKLSRVLAATMEEFLSQQEHPGENGSGQSHGQRPRQAIGFAND